MGSLNKIKNIFKFGRTSSEARDDGEFPIQQVEFMGKVGNTTIWFPYGYHASVPIDYLMLLFCISGVSESRIGFPGSPQQRPRSIEPGENIIYNPVTGDYIYFKLDGTIEVVASTKVSVQAPTVDVDASISANVAAPAIALTGVVTITGDVNIVGNVATTGTLLNNTVNVGSTHVHGGVVRDSQQTDGPQ